MFARPEKMRVEEREMVFETVRAMRMGRRVPRSPKEPEISERGWWVKVRRL